MLPIILIAYRHGVAFGSFTALAYGFIQMLLGMKNVLYFTTPLSVAAVIFLDYIFAFTALGLGGAFRKVVRRQATALELGTLLALCGISAMSFPAAPFGRDFPSPLRMPSSILSPTTRPT